MTNQINNQSIIPSTDMIQLTLTTTQVVEMSVTVNNNSPIQDYVHPDDQTQPTFDYYYYYYYYCYHHHHHHHHYYYFLTERESISDDITSSFHYTLYRILASTVIFDTRNQHLSFYTKTDFDECKDQDLNKCHEKAKCTNTEGSYNCTCIDGYVGDGFLCQGNGCFFVVYFITIYMMVN